MSRKCTKQDIIDNYALALPIEQMPFKGTKPYLDLCDAIFAVLSATADDRPEKQQAYYHMRQQWDHYCKFQTEQAEKHIEEMRIEQEARMTKIDQMRQKKEEKLIQGWWQA